MSTPILTTKFFPPPPPGQIVPRPRLAERLETGLRQGRRLAVVSAPAGFGKTTLVVESCQRLAGSLEGIEPAAAAGRRAAWLSLEPADNDPQRFWRYAVTALRRACPAAGEMALEMLDAPQPPPVEMVLTSLLNDMATAPDPVLLVLDDYHHIVLDEIHRGLNFLLDHLSPRLAVIITTRADPPLSLARRRGRGEMVELRAADLRFSRDESFQFLNEQMKLGLSPQDVDTLLRRTEGWVAGLQLAALAMHGIAGQPPAGPGEGAGQDLHDFVSSFAGDDQYIGDYLVEEVLSRQPEEVQGFMLRTSVLERFNAECCAAVTADQAGLSPARCRELLERLDHSNLFLVPLDNRQEWFRYHRLFAELLQRRLRQTLGTQVEKELNLRASGWFEERRLWGEAFEHAMQARDAALAAQLVRDSADDLIAASQLNTLREWALRLPREQALADPVLCVKWSWAALATGRAQETEMLLDALEQRHHLRLDLLTAGPKTLRAMDPDLVMALVSMAAQRATIAVGGVDIPRGMQLARDTLDCLSALEGCPEYAAARAVEMVPYFNLGLGYEAMGEVELASQAFSAAILSSRKYGNLNIILLATSHLGQLRLASGQLAEAVEAFQAALRAADDFGVRPSPLIAVAHAGLGQVFYEWNDLDAAAEAFEDSLRLGRPWNNWESLLPAGIGLARLRCARRDVAGALAVLDEIDQTSRNMYQADSLPFLQGWRALLSGQWEKIPRILAAFQDESEWNLSTRMFYSLERLALLQGRLLIASQQHAQALALLEGLAGPAESGGRAGILIEALALQAVALEGLRRPVDARVILERALGLAGPASYARLFVDAGLPALRLLYGIARGEGPSARYAARLLAAFPPDILEQGEKDLPLEKPLIPGIEPPAEPLSDREVEVLRLLAEGLTNAQAAARLVIASGTVKVHANNIYAKLGVSSRGAAVARARQLGIL